MTGKTEYNNVTRVLATGVGGGGNGEQIIKTLRLAGNKYYIVGTDISPFGSGLYMADEGYTVPPVNDRDYVNTLLRICADLDLQVVIPGLGTRINDDFSKKGYVP